MKIYIGSDHNGFALKKNLIEYLQRAGYDTEDAGDERLDPEDDFPIFAARVATKILSSSDPDPRGVLICGSGQGMMMAANRFKGIRAGLGWSVRAAKEIRNDEDSNVIALPAELFNDDKQTAYVILEAWLSTPYAHAVRFDRRNQELDNLPNA